jgi:hypothetical protein
MGRVGGGQNSGRGRGDDGPVGEGAQAINAIYEVVCSHKMKVFSNNLFNRVERERHQTFFDCRGVLRVLMEVRMCCVGEHIKNALPTRLNGGSVSDN